MRIVFITCLLSFPAGCGNSMPDVAEVKKHMAAKQLAIGEPILNSLGMVMVPIPAGEFQMGTAVSNQTPEQRFEKLMQDPGVKEKLEGGQTTQEDLRKWATRQADEDRRKANGPEAPQHLVKITKSFFISSCEVTQQQFQQVTGKTPWTGKPLVYENANYAATYITWDMAAEFCKTLSGLEKAEYRLPTEAEWEYACRAGTDTARYFGDDGKQLDAHAWFDTNAYKAGQQYAHAVGQKQPNPWALFDMYGNTWEWCQDWYAPYDEKLTEVTDPRGPERGRSRVWRGGSFSESPPNIRSASRGSWDREHYRPEYIAGFRIVKTMGATQ